MRRTFLLLTTQTPQELCPRRRCPWGRGMVPSLPSLEVSGRSLAHKCHPVTLAVCPECQPHRDSFQRSVRSLSPGRLPSAGSTSDPPEPGDRIGLAPYLPRREGFMWRGRERGGESQVRGTSERLPDSVFPEVLPPSPVTAVRHPDPPKHSTHPAPHPTPPVSLFPQLCPLLPVPSAGQCVCPAPWAA